MMDTTFEDEDVFKQFDYRPLSPTKTESTTASSNNQLANKPCGSVTKTEILDILNIVQSSLEKTWMMSCGGEKRRLRKLETLKELKGKIESCPDDMNLSMVMEFAMAPKSCIPPLFGRDPNRIISNTLENTLEFLDEHMNGGDESDNATIGGSIAVNDEELEMMTAYSNFSIDESSYNSSVFTESNYDADSERGANTNSFASEFSEDTDDVVVTTCNVENELGPLGVSITTWSRRKINGESMRSKMTASLVAEAEAEAEGTSGSDDEQEETVEEGEEEQEEEEETVEEVQVAIGDVVVRASRTRSVRFTGIKPTTEDNISRAMELLQSARMMREKMSESASD